MKKQLLKLCFLISITMGATNDPTFNWAYNLAPFTSFSYKIKAIVDSDGNIYTSGCFQGLYDFDPSPSSTYALNSRGLNDIFIQKVDSDGKFIWAKQIGGTSEDYIKNIGIDGGGNIYLSGNFSSTDADFDPSLALTNTLSSSNGGMFLLKLDDNADFLWVKQVHSILEDSFVDNSGNIYNTGTFNGTVDFDPSISTTFTLTSVNKNMFTQKLDQNGSLLWVKQVNASPHHLNVDINGNIFLTGSFDGTVDFDPSMSTHNLTSTSKSSIFYEHTTFVQKLNGSGDFLWAYLIDNSFNPSIVTDSNGEAYVLGSYYDTTDLNPSPAATYNVASKSSSDNDIFLQKIDANGNFLWAKHSDANNLNYTRYNFKNTLAISNDDYVYCTSGFIGITDDMDPSSSNTYTLTSNDGGLALRKWDKSGNFIWVKQFGADTAAFLNVDSNKNIYLLGVGNGDLDPLPTSSYFLPERDFILKLKQENNNSTCLITIYPTDSAICLGASTTLTASGANNYSWSPSIGLNTVTGATVVATPSVTTTYTVSDISSCPGQSQTITISVNNQPNYTIAPDVITKSNVQYPIIVFTGSNGSPPYTFYYTVNDGPVQSISTQSDKDTVSLLVPANSPTTWVYKTVSVEDANACTQNQTDSIVFKVNPPLAISDLSKQEKVTVFPNPVHSLLNLQVYSPASVTIKDITGREVYAGNINAGTSVVNVSQLSSGIYFVIIKNNSGVTTQKIIKQ